MLSLIIRKQRDMKNKTATPKTSTATQATPAKVITTTAPVTPVAPIAKVIVIRTAEMRTASALKAAATKTPEQRSNAAKSAWITIRANRAAAALVAAKAA